MTDHVLEISDAALPWVLGIGVTLAGIAGAGLAALVFHARQRWLRRRAARSVNLGRHLRLIHPAPNGCDDCSVEPGERHRYAGCPGNRREAVRLAKGRPL